VRLIDYFFISSPLHLFISASIAVQGEADERVAVVITRNPQDRARLQDIAGRDPLVFNRVIAVPATGVVNRRGIKASVFKTLHAEFCKPLAMRIFTGNDRRIEFQYAMHVARRSGLQVEGIYMDEGAVTYSGHKSIGSIQHRWIDPLFKKLFYGFWYSNALTTGASSWVRTVYAAFPDSVHPLLKRKHVIPIDVAPFKTGPLKAIASSMLEAHPEYPALLAGIKAVFTLPHEGAYVDAPEAYAAVGRHLYKHFAPADIAIKPHPRMTRRDLPASMFPGTVLLDHRIGMEAILPLLGDSCVVVGDISSTLLTTRWLRPDLRVLALVPEGGVVGGMADLYHQLDIPMIQGGDLGTLLWCNDRPDRPAGTGTNPGSL